MSVVRAHSALHEDARAGSALHLVQIDGSLDEELLEPSTVEIVEPAAIPGDVEAVAQEPAPQETVTAEPVDEGDATFTERRAVARRDTDTEAGDPLRNRKQNNPPPRGCVTSSMPSCWKYF